MSITKDFIKYIPAKFVGELDALRAEMNNLEEFESTLEAYGRECMVTPKIKMRSPSEFFKEYRATAKSDSHTDNTLVASEEESAEDTLVASDEAPMPEPENPVDTYCSNDIQQTKNMYEFYKSKNKKH